MNKIDKIKKVHAASTPTYYDHLAANAYEYITYLLQEIERKHKALEEIRNTEDLLTGGTAESMRRRAREAL